MAAFRYYVDEGWGVPLLETSRLNQPAGINIAFTDSLPLLALTAKLLEPLGIDPGRWWAWWYLGIHAAQGAAAAWAARAWGNRSPLVAAAVAAIAVSAPILLIRTWHPGLAGQFALLAAWAWTGELRPEGGLRPSEADRRTRAATASAAALVVVALLVHVYLLLGVLVVVAGGVGDLVVTRRWRLREASVWAVTVAGSLTVVGLLCGYFSAGAAEAPGYDSVGMHLFGPVVAQQSTLWPGNEWTIEASGSFEAFNWVGFGWLLLVAVGVAFGGLRRLGTGLLRHQVLTAVLVVLAAYAITPVIRFWDDDPHDLRTPLAWWVDDADARRLIWGVVLVLVVAVGIVANRRSGPVGRLWCPAGVVLGGAVGVLGVSLLTSTVLIDAVTGQFRSAGRLFWPVSYGSLVVAGGLIGRQLADLADGRFPGRRSVRRRATVLSVLVVVAALLQVVDVEAWRDLAGETLHPTVERRARLDAMAAMLDGVEAVRLEPSFTCAEDYGGAEGLWSFQDVGIVASWDRLPINRAYGARQAYEPCDAVIDPELTPGQALVVVLPVEVADGLLVRDPSWVCRRSELVLVCR